MVFYNIVTKGADFPQLRMRVDLTMSNKHACVILRWLDVNSCICVKDGIRSQRIFALVGSQSLSTS